MKLLFLLNPTAGIVNMVTKPISRRVSRVIEGTVEKVSPTAADTLRKFNETVENTEHTVDNFFDAVAPINITNRQLFETKNLLIGDHLYVQRLGYTHHAVYIGNQEVIHYLIDQGIVKESVEKFTAGAKIQRKYSLKDYSSNEIVSRAYSRLGESDYNLLYNNCEHFVRWCRSGRL